jgi:hypothetical protein
VTGIGHYTVVLARRTGQHDARPLGQRLCRRRTWGGAGATAIATYKAKGVIPEDDASVIGGASLYPVSDRTLFKAVRAAALILCLGYDPVEMRDA